MSGLSANGGTLRGWAFAERLRTPYKTQAPATPGMESLAPVGVYGVQSMGSGTLYSEAFATAARARGVGIGEVKSFAIEAARKFQYGVAEVEEALEVGDDFGIVVLKDLILGLQLIVEVHLVRESATATAGHGYAHEVIIGKLVARFDFVDFGFCTI